ncbi:hypothetical protein MP228_012091 [Amoeboaphelidium protococcarum]|nr:hypothetical protein MP228_012091 [Amoeboaphelidium protococcarum]
MTKEDCKVAFVTVGTRGDVQPFVLLGEYLLQNTSYKPTIVTNENYKQWIESKNINFQTMFKDKKDVDAELARPDMAEAIAKGDTTKFLEMIAEPPEVETQKLEAIIEICRDHDLIIGNQITMLFTMLAGKIVQKPSGLWLTYPSHRTSFFPNPLLPIPNLKLWNGLSYDLLDKVMWKMQQPLVSAWAEKYNVELPQSAWQFRQWTDSHPAFYAVSSVVLQKPADWPANAMVGGYILDRSDSIEKKLDDALEQFISQAQQDNQSVIYIGFGSMPVTISESFKKFIGEFCDLVSMKNLQWRIVLYVGKSTPGASALVQLKDLPSYVYPLAGCAHSLLFPKCDFIVHHGGSGTTAAALASGTPSMVVSCFGDQPYYGKQTYNLLGRDAPKSQTYQKLQAKKLVAAIQQGLNPKLKSRAREVAAQISFDEGFINATSFLDQLKDTSFTGHDVNMGADQPQR